MNFDKKIVSSVFCSVFLLFTASLVLGEPIAQSEASGKSPANVQITQPAQTVEPARMAALTTVSNPDAASQALIEQNTAPQPTEAMGTTTSHNAKAEVTTSLDPVKAQPPVVVTHTRKVTKPASTKTKRSARKPSVKKPALKKHDPQPLAAEASIVSSPPATENVLVVNLEPQPVPGDSAIQNNQAQEKQGLISRVVSATKGLVSRAFTWLGTRYVWGGSSRRGVDCSGLTRLLYMGEGIGLPHNARMQFKRGQAVRRAELLPGDLVFFNTRGPLTHVGIYVGNDQFLHAANPRRGVRIDSLDSPYYKKRFAGARRYKNPQELG